MDASKLLGVAINLSACILTATANRARPVKCSNLLAGAAMMRKRIARLSDNGSRFVETQ